MRTIYTGWGKAIYSKGYKKLMNFVKTEKGKQFVSKLHTDRLDVLAKRYNCPYVLFFKNDKKNYMLIQKACDDNGIVIVKTTILSAIKPNIIDYTHIPKNLTKKEIVEIDKRRPKKVQGFAERLHRIEMHKMDKWERKHPEPTKEELKSDLFPELLRKGWLKMYQDKQERIRDFIISVYCKNSLPVIGRIKVFKNKYEDKILGYVEDKLHEFKNVGPCGDIEDKPPMIIKKAYRIFLNAANYYPNIISGRLESKDGTKSRILILNPPKQYRISA